MKKQEEKAPVGIMKQLSLGNKIFADTRIMLDAYLNMLIRTIIEKDLHSGSVGLKINVDIKTQVTDDGEIIYVPEFEPKVSIKVGASGSDKCHVKKGLIMKRSHDGKNYLCDNQISMEDVAKEQKGA
jgi:hypothetical protein